MPQYRPITEDGSTDESTTLIRKDSNACIKNPLVLAIIAFGLFGFSIGYFIYKEKLVPKKTKAIIKVWQTSEFHGDRLTSLDIAELNKRGFDVESMLFTSKRPCNNLSGACEADDISRVVVNSLKRYQSIFGFGGAFTEAAAHNFFKLPGKIREKVIDLYFGENGIGYTLGRVHINSCDFSLDSYSFDDVSKDYDLKFFDTEVTHDQDEIIPFIRAAMKTSKETIRLLASPWSPPAWLKLPGPNGKRSMSGSASPSCLRNTHRARDTWAKYISKFVEAYKGQGVPIWGVTPQNEPEFAAPWEACAYNTSTMSQFINQHLGPILEEDHPEVLILGFDHNKHHLEAWTRALVEGEGANYLDGIAFHWYDGDDRLMDGTFGYDAVNATHHIIPDKLLINSEGCSCPGVRVGDWLRAERLGHDLIFDLNNWANGWIDWNLMLDSEGGPNHLKNNCDAGIIALPGYSDVYIQPSFYYMAHLSKFVPPQSVRVHSEVVGNFRYANVDPGVRAGIELGMFPCELSTRQLWRQDPKDGILKLSKKSLNSESSDGLLVVLCAADGDDIRGVLRLIACEYEGQPPAIALLPDADGHLRDNSTGHCFDLANGVQEPGALLKLVPCEDSSTQLWSIEESGEIRSNATGLCLTAGWPFLTGASFVDPHEQTVLVIMNEAPVDSAFVVEDSLRGYFSTGINARSIQTISY